MCTFENLLSRLQQAKIKSKLRTEDISAISGIPVGTLSKIFAGITKDPKIGTLIAISNALDVSVDYLIYGKISRYDITPNEIEIIQKYRQLDADGKQRIENQLNFEVEQTKDKESAPSGAQVSWFF